MLLPHLELLVLHKRIPIKKHFYHKRKKDKKICISLYFLDENFSVPPSFLPFFCVESNMDIVIDQAKG